MCAQSVCEHVYRTDVNMHAQSRDEDTRVQKWNANKHAFRSDKCLHAKWSLNSPVYMKTEVVSQFFVKSSNIKFHKSLFSGNLTVKICNVYDRQF